ncbi:MAG: hypothetical protein HYW51_03595 [Candidatus Doudnabacteria bacterium]|nr:hypothetical protein [Candidatus Doudnabacteria bacterium]
MKKKLIILLFLSAFIAVAYLFLRFGNSSTGLIWNLSKEGTWLLPLVVVSGFLDSIGPCSFAVLLLTIAFLFSIGELRSSILKIGLAYIVGIFVAYLLIGLGLLQALHIFNVPHFMAKLGAGLLIILGLINLLNWYLPKFPLKLGIPNVAHHKMAVLMEKASIPTAFLLGGLVGLCEFPCTGGPYLLVLGLLHDQATYLKGVWYLLLYNLIFVFPLIIVLLIASEKSLVDKFQTWHENKKADMRLYGSIAMIVLGIIIFLF